MSLRPQIFIGTAGWNLPAVVRERFAPGESLLHRYASVLDVVEINSSFYRPHRRATYERWAASTSEGFRFAVKTPRTITHDARLAGGEALIDRFFDEVGGLGAKLGPILIQLPPSLAFDADAAAIFFNLWRDRFDGETALEPRHASWFTPAADVLLIGRRIVRVEADPAPAPSGGEPGGWRGFRYVRLHGAPVIYESNYADEVLQHLAAQLAPPAYVMFDNTKFGHAAANALSLQALLSDRVRGGLSGDLSP